MWFFFFINLDMKFILLMIEVENEKFLEIRLTIHFVLFCFIPERHMSQRLCQNFFFEFFGLELNFCDCCVTVVSLLCDCCVTVASLLCHCSLTIVSLQFDCCVTVASLSRNCRATVVGKTIICRNIFAFWLSPSVARENKNSQRER